MIIQFGMKRLGWRGWWFWGKPNFERINVYAGTIDGRPYPDDVLIRKLDKERQLHECYVASGWWKRRQLDFWGRHKSSYALYLYYAYQRTLFVPKEERQTVGGTLNYNLNYYFQELEKVWSSNHRRQARKPVTTRGNFTSWFKISWFKTGPRPEEIEQEKKERQEEREENFKKELATFGSSYVSKLMRGELIDSKEKFKEKQLLSKRIAIFYNEWFQNPSPKLKDKEEKERWEKKFYSLMRKVLTPFRELINKDELISSLFHETRVNASIFNDQEDVQIAHAEKQTKFALSYLNFLIKNKEPINPNVDILLTNIYLMHSLKLNTYFERHQGEGKEKEISLWPDKDKLKEKEQKQIDAILHAFSLYLQDSENKYLTMLGLDVLSAEKSSEMEASLNLVSHCYAALMKRYTDTETGSVLKEMYDLHVETIRELSSWNWDAVRVAYANHLYTFSVMDYSSRDEEGISVGKEKNKEEEEYESEHADISAALGRQYKAMVDKVESYKKTQAEMQIFYEEQCEAIRREKLSSHAMAVQKRVYERNQTTLRQVFENYLKLDASIAECEIVNLIEQASQCLLEKIPQYQRENRTEWAHALTEDAKVQSFRNLIDKANRNFQALCHPDKRSGLDALLEENLQVIKRAFSEWLSIFKEEKVIDVDLVEQESSERGKEKSADTNEEQKVKISYLEAMIGWYLEDKEKLAGHMDERNKVIALTSGLIKSEQKRKQSLAETVKFKREAEGHRREKEEILQRAEMFEQRIQELHEKFREKIWTNSLLTEEDKKEITALFEQYLKDEKKTPLEEVSALMSEREERNRNYAEQIPKQDEESEAASQKMQWKTAKLGSPQLSKSRLSLLTSQARSEANKEKESDPGPSAVFK